MTLLPSMGKPVIVKVKGLTKPLFGGDFIENLEISEVSKDSLSLMEPLFAASVVVLVPTNSPNAMITCHRLTARVKVFTKISSQSSGEELLIPGRQLVMHCGPAAVVVMVTRIVEGQVTRKRLAGGEAGIVEIESLALPVVVYPEVSRIVLRHRGLTVAAGVVIS